MYKVSEIGNICGVSNQAVYKALTRIDKRLIEIIDGIKYVNQEGYDILVKRFKDKHSSKQFNNNLNEEIIKSYISQLEEKDKQITNLMNQIDILMRQNENFQILIKREQDIKASIEPVKKSNIFKRIFKYKD